jgi:plastocyanin
VTSEGGAFGSDVLGNGETFTTRFQEAGTYAYFCAIHPTMKGTIEVT